MEPLKQWDSADLYKINAYYAGIQKSKPYFSSGRLRKLHDVWHELEQRWAFKCRTTDIEYLRDLAPIEKLEDYSKADVSKLWYPYFLMRYGREYNMECFKHCRWEKVFEEQNKDIMTYFRTNRPILSSRIRGWTSPSGQKIIDLFAATDNIQNVGTSCSSNVDGIVPHLESNCTPTHGG